MQRPKLIVLTAFVTLLALTAVGCGDDAGESEIVPDIPVFPDAYLTNRFDEEDRDPTDVYEVVGKPADEVLEWYRARMADAGWFAVTDESDDVIIYNDVDGCYAFVSATQDGDNVMLQISQQRRGTPCIPGRPLDSPSD